jgi:16S rRNA C967 or C1407 C5-methylase (RsmB/RsmF family)
VELVRSRFFKLRNNLQAQGATAVRTFLQNGERVWRYRPEHFDRVLLDAPCSSEGRFTTEDPQTYAYWSHRKIAEMARKQRRLLFSGIQALRPGGILVYSTCTFAPEENEAVLDWMLARFGEALAVEPTVLELDNMVSPLPEWNGRVFLPGVAHGRRILPTTSMQSFFIARIRKDRSTCAEPHH